MIDDPRIARVIALIRAALLPPPGTGRVALALALGAICHARFATITLSEDALRLLPRGTHDPTMFIKPRELRDAMRGAGLVPGPTTGLGPRGVDRRLDLTFGPLPLTAILYMGPARKPGGASGDPAC